MRRLSVGTQLRMCSISIARTDAVSRRDLVRLASSPMQVTVRVTGGAGNMASEEGAEVANFLAEALGGATCTASVLAGATTMVKRPSEGNCSECDRARMYCRHHSGNIVRHPGVMDVLPRLAELEAPGKTIGITPTINPPVYWGASIIIEDNPRDDFYTIVSDRTPVCVLVQFSSDRPGLTWDDEWQVCLEYMQLLRDEGDHRSLHLVYNGGQTTRNEVLHVARLTSADNPWRVLLVEDSGREATMLANDLDWRKANPQVVSCKRSDLRRVIREMGFAP